MVPGEAPRWRGGGGTVGTRETGGVASGLAVLVWRSDGLLSVETVNSKFELEHEQGLEYWAKTAVMMLKMPKASNMRPISPVDWRWSKSPGSPPSDAPIVLNIIYMNICVVGNLFSNFS